MKYFWTLLSVGWAVAVGVIVLIVVYLVRPTGPEFTDLVQETGAPTVGYDDPARGNLGSGTVAVVSFNQFTCETCSAVNDAIVYALERQGEHVIHIWKDLPNPSVNPASQTASVASRCAQRQGAFWEYHDLLFKHRADTQEDLYIAIANELQLNIGSFERCMEKEKPLDLIREHVMEADALDVLVAPTVYVGEQRFTGTVDGPTLEKAILEELNQ